MCIDKTYGEHSTMELDADLWGSNEEVVCYLRRFKHCADPPAGVNIKYRRNKEDAENA